MKVRRAVAWVVLAVTGAFFLIALGAKYGWGTPLLVGVAIIFAWALREVIDG